MESSAKLNFPPPQGPATDAFGEPSQARPAGAPPSPASALLARAKADDAAAIATMFAQFIPGDEHLVSGHYMGVLGLWGIGNHSFAGVTQRRLVVLRISLLGGVVYQDAAIEHTNSAAMFQPSRITLYFYILASILLFSLPGFVIGPGAGIALAVLSVMLLPITIRVYYRFQKSGLVVWVREGIPVYAFIDRKRMPIAADLYRKSMSIREERLRSIGHP
jgi:hypothetical protein